MCLCLLKGSTGKPQVEETKSKKKRDSGDHTAARDAADDAKHDGKDDSPSRETKDVTPKKRDRKKKDVEGGTRVCSNPTEASNCRTR